MWLNELKYNLEKKSENPEMWNDNKFFNEEEYNLWLSKVDEEKRNDKNEREWQINNLVKNLVDEEDSELLDKIDWSIFENETNKEELGEICKNLIKKWMLEFGKKGKITWAFVDVWWEKKSSKLFDSLLKAWFSQEQTLKYWLQTRTKIFKDWFGDRINNPQNASKIVDENGEPLLVYHWSTKKFENFDIGKIGSTTWDKSWFYFSNDRRIAKGYYSKETGNWWDNIKVMLGLSRKFKPTVYDCFLNAKNPYIKDFNGEYDKKWREKIIADAKEKWHDVVILKNIMDGPPVVQDVYVVFHPDQIKLEYK